MPTKFVLLVVSSCLTVACAAPTDDAQERAPVGATESAQTSADETVLSCDNGSAVVHVNPGERRELSIDIKNREAVKWLTGASLPRGITYGADGTMNISGWSGWGVFDHASFSKFSDADEAGVAINVFRDGTGLKVQSTSFNYDRTKPLDEHEVRNWWFSDCTVR